MSANRGPLVRGAIARLHSAGLVSSSQSESLSVAAQAVQRATTAEREVEDLRNKTASLEQGILNGKAVSARSIDVDTTADNVDREIDGHRDAAALLEPSVLDVKTTVTTSNEAHTRVDAAQREVDTLHDKILQSDQHVGTACARSDEADEVMLTARSRISSAAEYVRTATGDGAVEREVEYLRDKNTDLENRIQNAETAITESRDAHARAEDAERRCQELEAQLMKALALGNTLQSQSCFAPGSSATHADNTATACDLDVDGLPNPQELTDGDRETCAPPPQVEKEMPDVHRETCAQTPQVEKDNASKEFLESLLKKVPSACRKYQQLEKCAEEWVEECADMLARQTNSGCKPDPSAADNIVLTKTEKETEPPAQSKAKDGRECRIGEIGEKLEVAAVAAVSEVRELLQKRHRGSDDVVAGDRSEPENVANSPTSAQLRELPKLASTLVDLGFSVSQAREAAQRHSSVEAAVGWILSLTEKRAA